jgi:non-homologous end joining protein Ku
MTKRDEYVANAKRQLDDWSADMDVLDAKVQKAADGAKEKYRAQLVTLRAKRQEGEKTLAAIKSASEDSWEHLKSETENLLEALKDSVHQFKLHFPAKTL